MKSEKVIREMIEQFKFDNEADKAHMNTIDEEIIRNREEWIKCLMWVLESDGTPLLTEDEKGTFISCTNCGSLSIGHSTSVKKYLNNNTKRVSYKVFCKNCNTKAIVEEKWKVN